MLRPIIKITLCIICFLCHSSQAYAQLPLPKFEKTVEAKIDDQKFNIPTIIAGSVQPKDGGMLVNINLQADLINLQSQINTLLVKKLDKSECEDKIRVRSSSLTPSSPNALLKSKIYYRKRYCSSFIKTDLLKETFNVSIILVPSFNDQEIRLKAVVEDVDVGNSILSIIDLKKELQKELDNDLNRKMVYNLAKEIGDYQLSVKRIQFTDKAGHLVLLTEAEFNLSSNDLQELIKKLTQ